MDDWTIYSLLKEDVALLCLIFDRCREFHMSLNLKNCIFCVPHGNLLGHIVCREGVLVDPTKFMVIVNMSPTTSVKNLCSTMGHTRYYHKFIRRYENITPPLENLLKKVEVFQWTLECSKVLETLKEKLDTIHILIFPNWENQFHVRVDASGIALGAILSQPGERAMDHPIFFPQMNIDVFWSITPDEFGGMQFVHKPYFINFFNSSIMTLKDLPFFSTTGEVVKRTKFPIRRVHEISLWLDMRYPIHTEDIHQLTGLSLEGEDVSKGFQGPSKNGKKKGEPNLYEGFYTQRGGGGGTAKIEPILPETVRTGCYIIANKVMRSYYKGECTLDALSVAYFCANGTVFN
jgi:hypothetical protein